MKPSLFDYIVCPDCKTKLHITETKPGDIDIGEILLCENNHYYTVKEGVPCLLMSMDDEQRDTADSFSHKWSSVPDYGYEENTRKFHREWYLERYDWSSERALKKVLSNSEVVLDAGVGVGRDVEWYASLTKSPVFGVDIGESVHIAQQTLISIPNVHIVQADIMNLPFEDLTFDFIVSDFVLHHTPDTKQALANLVRLLKPGGMISFYVYRKKGDIREACDDMLREVTTKMSHEDCMKFSEAMMQFGKALTDISLEFQRKIYWDIMKCFWNPDFTEAHNISVNYDWYKPVYAWRHNPDEVHDWCVDLGIRILHWDEQKSGISVRGIKL